MPVLLLKLGDISEKVARSEVKDPEKSGRNFLWRMEERVRT